MINHWVGIGRLGKDVELRYTAQGKPYATFSVAIDDGFGDKKKTYWVSVVTWDKLAEMCGNSLHKGSKVCVEGKWTSRTSEKNGAKQTFWDVVANRVEFLDPKGQGQQENGRPPLSQDYMTEEVPF